MVLIAFPGCLRHQLGRLKNESGESLEASLLSLVPGLESKTGLSRDHQWCSYTFASPYCVTSHSMKAGFQEGHRSCKRSKTEINSLYDQILEVTKHHFQYPINQNRSKPTWIQAEETAGVSKMGGVPQDFLN